MSSNKIQNKIYISQNLLTSRSKQSKNIPEHVDTRVVSDSVSFTGATGNMTKKGWFFFRNLSDKMKDVSEITNALIAAIGTGIIAPLIILVSPGKGDKDDKDKKFFQAIRQPLSAGLALGFQVPMTLGINKYINKLAYKDKIKMFDDETLGSLIPDKKYLKKQITSKELEEWDAKFDKVVNGKSLKKELEDKLRQNYKEVGLDVSDEVLAECVKKEKTKFLKDKIVEEKHNRLFDEKVKELEKKKFNIKDIDLVTDGDRQLAIHRNKNAYDAIEKGANLSLYDKTMRMMGFSTKKVKELEKKQKAFATEKGLEILKKENKSLFTNPKLKLRKFIETQDVHSQKLFGNKKFWLSLFVNLFMVSASCYALNWTHPRFKELIDKHRNKNSEADADSKKVEVK